MRQCGECFACCVTPEIKELQKPAGECCRHLTPEGKCGVYETRPQVCRDFECGWKLSSKLREDDQPNLVGLMVMGLQRGGINVVHELRPKALDSWKGQRLVKRLAHGQLLGLARYGKPATIDQLQICGPATLIGKFDAYVKSKLGNHHS